jgi:hypothetical protein
MPGPNVLELVGDIREAVERLPREQLVDVLVYVFKEYVVEGAPLSSAMPTPLPDDLAGMSFAEVVRSLQLRLDLPELELFEVQGERVCVRLQGRPVPLEVTPARAEPLPAAAPTPPAPAAGPVAAPAATQQSARVATQQTPPPAAVSTIATTGDAPAPAPAATQQPAPAPAARTGGGLLEID